MDTKMIDITAEESEAVGQLIDLLHDHLNEYELFAEELEALNKAEDVLARLWFLFHDIK